MSDAPPFPLRPGSEARYRRLQELQRDPSGWVRAPDNVCPRCGGDVPEPGKKGAYLGAASRTDDRTEVCSPCGDEEGWEQRAGQLTAQSEWPVAAKSPGWRRTVVSGPKGWRDTWGANRSNRSHHPMPPPTPRELPDLRLHLLERWIEGGTFEWSVALRQEAGQLLPGWVSGHSEWERQVLREASLWWIKGDMVALTTAAARSVPDDLMAGDIDLPAEQAYGLAVLAEPWRGLDADHEGGVTVHAVTWGPSRVEGQPALSLSFYRYLTFDGGLGKEDLDLAVSSGIILDAGVARVGVTRDTGDAVERLYGGAWVWLGRSDWLLEEEVTQFGRQRRPVELADRRRESMIEDRRWFAALCTLVNHKLSEEETIHAPRQTRRRAERAGVHEKAAPSTVRLIRLREVRRVHGESDEAHEKRKVEYSHRWYSRGHWGWRRCGPGKTRRRRTFISPSVKGPKDKELILKEDVRVWVK